MNNLENNNAFIDRIERRDRRSKKYTLFATVVPIILAFIFLFYSINKLISANKEVNDLQNKISAQQNELKQLKEQLDEAVNFVDNVYQLKWINVKYLASRYPNQAALILKIWDLKSAGVGWQLGGFNPQDGFDSPSLVAYLLDELDLLKNSKTIRYELQKHLRKVSTPSVGDLIIYESGYTMFYFEDRDGTPFCIGMTPIGILTLKVNFGPPILGYYQVNY